jgi:type III restriction enzyme
VPGVNRLEEYGRWAFAELRDAFAIEEQYDQLVDSLVGATRPRMDEVV